MFIKSSKIYCTITFKSADRNALINYLNKIKLILLYNKNYKYTLVSKPKKIKRFFILRSPHVYKKSLETFEEQIFSKILTIQFDYSSILYSEFLSLITFIKHNTPLNINMTIKLHNNV